MPKLPGSGGDEPPRAGTAPALHQPGSPADVLSRQAGMRAFNLLQQRMSTKLPTRQHALVQVIVEQCGVCETKSFTAVCVLAWPTKEYRHSERFAKSQLRPTTKNFLRFFAGRSRRIKQPARKGDSEQRADNLSGDKGKHASRRDAGIGIRKSASDSHGGIGERR